MDNPEEKKTFNIIRFRGKPNEGMYKGKIVRRMESLFTESYGLIRCAPYDDHFIFRNPYPNEKGSDFICTCGSPAVAVSYTGYFLDASPQGKLFVCMLHATTGYHSNLQMRWV